MSIAPTRRSDRIACVCFWTCGTLVVLASFSEQMLGDPQEPTPSIAGQHLEDLASDSLEGRYPGTKGGREAENYVAEELRGLGLLPAGSPNADPNTLDGYFQRVPPAGMYARPARNVIAIRPGQIADEKAVVLSAHLDHLGACGTGLGDHIFNGANDNASGVAVLLGVASVLHAEGAKLKRPVVFAFFTMEERGMRGSRHWVANPTIGAGKPIGRTVLCCLNLDMVGNETISGKNEYFLTDYNSKMGKVFDNLKISLIKDAMRKRDLSDHCSFRGTQVMAHTLTRSAERRQARAHQVTDEVKYIDWKRLDEAVNDVVLVVKEIANNGL